MVAPNVRAEEGEWSWLLRYAATALGVLGGIEWLFGRTISRMAASPPLEGPPRTIIELIARIGIFLLPIPFVAAALLLFLADMRLSPGSQSRHSRSTAALGMYLSIFGA